jgi:hypothetical protein
VPARICGTTYKMVVSKDPQQKYLFVAAIPEAAFALKPPNLSFEEAAAVWVRSRSKSPNRSGSK